MKQVKLPSRKGQVGKRRVSLRKYLQKRKADFFEKTIRKERGLKDVSGSKESH